MGIVKELLTLADELEKTANEEFGIGRMIKMGHMLNAIAGLSVLKKLASGESFIDISDLVRYNNNLINKE